MDSHQNLKVAGAFDQEPVVPLPLVILGEDPFVQLAEVKVPDWREIPVKKITPSHRWFGINE